MNTTTKTFLIATALCAFSASADAQTQACAPQNGLPTIGGGICITQFTGDNQDAIPATTSPFYTLTGVTFPGIAVTPKEPAFTMVDTDGNPATPPVKVFTDKGLLGNNDIFAEAYGSDATAVGAGARVGQFVPASCTGGTLNGSGTACTGGVGTYKPATTIPANGGTAVGAGAVVQHEASTAVGAGSKSTDTHQVTLGTKGETIRAEGITSQKSKDRQIGPREVVTSDAGGRLATDGGEIFGRLDGHDQAITAQSALLSEHTARLNEQAKGLAIAMAMPDAWLGEKQRFAIAGGVGGFGDETAIAFSAIGRLDETWSLNAGFGGDTEFKEFGWKVGARAGW